MPSDGTPPDPAKVIFGKEPGGCLFYLIGNGVKENNARGVLGRWRGKYGDAAVIEVVAAAGRNAVSDPVPWIERGLSARYGQPEAQEVAPL